MEIYFHLSGFRGTFFSDLLGVFLILIIVVVVVVVVVTAVVWYRHKFDG